MRPPEVLSPPTSPPLRGPDLDPGPAYPFPPGDLALPAAAWRPPARPEALVAEMIAEPAWFLELDLDLDLDLDMDALG